MQIQKKKILKKSILVMKIWKRMTHIFFKNIKNSEAF